MTRSTITAAGLGLISALLIFGAFVLRSSPGGVPLAPVVIATPTPRQTPQEPRTAPTATNPIVDPRPVLRLPLMAYSAPDGEPLGGLEAGRPYIAVARYGAAWTQIDAEGSGRVWVREELQPGAPLPDLQPPPAPTPRPVVRQAVQPFTCTRSGSVGTFTGTSWISIDDACAQADAQIGTVVQPITMTPYVYQEVRP